MAHPEDEARRIGRELMNKSGSFIEARCKSMDDIDLVFTGGTFQVEFLKFGYAGMGTRCFHNFLTTVGVNISLDALQNLRSSTIIKSNGQVEKVRRQLKITVSAGSLSEAREKIKGQLPAGSTDISETITDDGSALKHKEGTGKTIELATSDARNNITKEAQIVDKRILSESNAASLRLQSFDEREARLAAKEKMPSNVIIDSVACVDEGKKGFWGFGKKLPTYEIAYTIPAKVEVAYQLASISVSFMEPA